MASGGGGGGRRAPPPSAAAELEKYVEKRVRVKFVGGREVTGLLKGFDGLVNLVLDECVEYFEGAGSRTLGLVVCRGPNVTTICPEDSLVEIENPFVAAESGAE